MARAMNQGWAVQVAYQELTQETFSKAMDKVLNNNDFKENATKISKRLKDLPQPPMDLAIFWTEYVLRNDGAHYMQSSARYLNFIEYHNLDIYAMFAFVVFLIIFIPLWVIRKIWKCFSSKSNQKQKKQ